eukprot:57600_1
MGSCETCSAADEGVQDIDIVKRVRSVKNQPESMESNENIEHNDDKSVSASTEHIEIEPSPSAESPPQMNDTYIQEPQSAIATFDDETSAILFGNNSFLEKDNDHDRYDTTRLDVIASDLFREMETMHQTEHQQLVSLNAWLEKKQSSIPYGWLRRWVVLKNGYILWSEWEQSVQHEIDSKEMNRWNKCIYLGAQDIAISAAESKKKRKFKINTTDREILFKAKDEKQRDIWINGVKEHIQYVQQNAFLIKSHTN